MAETMRAIVATTSARIEAARQRLMVTILAVV
jgi:hypothetical protein